MQHPMHLRRSMLRTTATGAAALLAILGFPATATTQVQQAMSMQGANGGDEIAFPKQLLPVGEGEEKLKITLGLDYKDAADLAEEIHPKNEAKRKALLATLRQELGGEKDFLIDPFFLSKYPVTNAQYKLFVESTGHRFPFHWWQDGRRQDFDSRFEEIRKAESKYVFWRQNWRELPWQIPEGDEDKPVVYVQWSDAVAYAAWAGCRLPSEVEWTYAMTGGDRDKQFPWGEEWDEDKLATSKFGLMDVGTYDDRFTGPFGHGDVALQVWEWMGDQRPEPFNGIEEWKKDLDRLKRTKAGHEVDFRDPRFAPEWRLMKGGSFNKTGGSFEARLFVRAPINALNVASAIGFRIAKSYRPAIDHARAAMSLNYSWNFFGGKREPNYDDHVGAERYDLSPDGVTIRGYHAVSIIPVTHYAEEDKPRLAEINELTRGAPMVVGTLATTEKLVQPAVERGYHTVMYRKGGLSKELTEALRRAQADLRKLEKINSRKKEGEPLEKPDENATWQGVLVRYGISQETAKEKGTQIEKITLSPGNLEIPVDEDLFLIRDPLGEYASFFPAKKALAIESKYEGATATIAPDEKGGGEIMTFEVGIPSYLDSRKRIMIQFPVILSAESAGNGSWRLPE